MDKNQRKHLIDTLINVYNIDETEIKKMSDSDIELMLKKLQKERIDLSKNPNKFWYIKELPAPKTYVTKTSSKWGALIVLSLFITLALFLGLFLYMAFNH